MFRNYNVYLRGDLMFDKLSSMYFASLPDKIIGLLPSVLWSAVIVIIGIWIGNLSGKLVIKILTKQNVDKSVHHFLSRFTSFFIKTIFVVMALSNLGFDISSFVTALGAAGITAGLGLKDCISQFASGIQILFNKPFKNGDFVEIDGLTGTVEDIRFMNTSLITVDNKKVIIPNNHVTCNDLVNYSSQKIRRIDFPYSISYKQDMTKAKEVVLSVAGENPFVLKNPVPFVGVKTHAEHSIVLECQVWCNCSDYWNTYFSMQESVKNAFDKNGIEIPYEQLDVHIK